MTVLDNDPNKLAGFTGHYKRGKNPAIVVVDLSNGFTDPDCALGSNLDDVVDANNQLLDVARAKGVPIMFTSIVLDETGTNGGVWTQKVGSLPVLKAGSRWVEIDPRLNRRSNEIIVTKQGASAFSGTNLAAVLASLRVDTIIVTGASTSGCIRATGIDGMQNGYPTLIPYQCVGDRHAQAHEANLFDLDSKYADVLPLEEVIEYINSINCESK